MKPISSAITGMASPEPRGASSTGSERGATGYAARPPRSYGLDHEPTEAPTPVVRTERPSSLQSSRSLMPSPLPELRQVWLGVAQDGARLSTMLLARQSDLPALKSSISQMRAELEPASPEEIAATMARLFSHYPSPQAGNTLTVAQDWLEDIGQVSAKAFRQAVTEWRRGPNAFRPSPGQLLALIARIEGPVRERLETAEEILAREQRMTKRERLGHLHQRKYEIEELGMVPFDVHLKGHDEIAIFLAEEAALIKAEIAQVEAQEV